jgi:hypothetical protein
MKTANLWEVNLPEPEVSLFHHGQGYPGKAARSVAEELEV